MLDRLAPPKDATCLDLTCGTGFVTGELAHRSGGRVVGVDASSGMLNVARKQWGERCIFVEADAVAYLRSLPRDSVDIITCAWGLGYTRPWTILHEAARVLRSGGRIGIIDNTLFSLAGVLRTSIFAFAEYPEALVHIMRVRFLPAGWFLALLMRMAGLAVVSTWDGAKTYHVPDGSAAIARLTSTGAAAGFEFAADERYRDEVFKRFAEILEETHRSSEGIPITHRYLAAVGQKR
jgi:SAM-dependent methyltransferase